MIIRSLERLTKLPTAHTDGTLAIMVDARYELTVTLSKQRDPHEVARLQGQVELLDKMIEKLTNK